MVNADIEKDIKSCVYAALILLDCKKEVNASSLGSILKVANVDVESYMMKIFSNAISGCSSESLLTMNPVAASAVAPIASAPVVEDTKKETGKAAAAKVEESESESDDGGGLNDLFDM